MATELPPIQPMTAMRPYLLRAIREWIVDNGLTPYLLVNADYPDLQIPPGFAENGRIVLNIAPSAAQDFWAGDEVSFSARFGGRPCPVRIPIQATLALYAKETGQGMVFPEEAAGHSSLQDSGPAGKGPDGGPGAGGGGRPRRPALKLVK